MKKLLHIFTATMVLVSGLLADLPDNYLMTNVTAWVGVNINASNVSNLPHRVSSTPGDAFLGFLRTFITGDLDAYVFHMSPLRRINQIGTDNLAAIPIGYRNRYSSYLLDTNLCIKSFSATSTAASRIKVAYMLEEICAGEREESEYDDELVFTNGEWKIEGDLSGDD